MANFLSLLACIAMVNIQISSASHSDEITFTTFASSDDEKVIMVCLYDKFLANLEIHRHGKSLNTTSYGVEYNGDPTCLFTGLSNHSDSVDALWVTVDFCETTPHGFINYKNRIDAIVESKEKKCSNSEYAQDSGNRVKRSLGHEPGICGNAFEEVSVVDPEIERNNSILRQRGEIPTNYGNISIPVALFYDSGFGLKFRTPEQLTSTLAAIGSLLRVSYQQRVWNTLATINIVVTHIAPLPQIDLTNRDANMLLNEFSRLQFAVRTNMTANGSSVTWASAILLLSRNVYYQGSARVTGLANLRRLCAGDDNDANSAAGVVEGRTMTSALVSAHELGHILGMNHDGPPRNEDCDANSFVLSPSVGSGKVSFSPCSVRDFRAHLDTQFTSDNARLLPCLYGTHVPAPGMEMASTMPPGRILNAKMQCEFGFGPAYDVDFAASQDGICPMMFCRHRFWRVQSGPALPGTLCQTTRDGQQFRCNDGGRCVRA